MAIAKIIDNKSEHVVALDDADPDILEIKRAELQKELELQLKMDTPRKQPTLAKELIRKRKKVRSSSSSSSSSSDSGSSSDSSSSISSKESRRKIRKNKSKRRNSSSSSDEPRSSKKLSKAKRVCHKKLDAIKSGKSVHSKKLLAVAAGGSSKLRKRTPSPGSISRKRALVASPSSASKLGHKVSINKSKYVTDATLPGKHHRLKETIRGDKDREFQHRERERERDREQHLRARDKERIRSRSPKLRVKSRTPTKRLSRSRDLKHKTPPPRRPPSKTRCGGGSNLRRERSLDRSGTKKDLKRHGDSRERERDRRDRERDAFREKERQELLVRSQRERERERLVRDKSRKMVERDRDDDDRLKTERLLPRPAERAMALAAARGRSREKSDERDRARSHSHSRSGVRERIDRGDKDTMVAYDRGYDHRDIDARYDHHRRMEKDDRPLIRDDRSRDYVVVRRRDDTRSGGPMIDSPYMARSEKRDRDDLHHDRDPYGVISSDQRYEDRVRDDRRAAHDYSGSRGGGGAGYIDERSHCSERDREWLRENEMARGVGGGGSGDDHGMIYDRHSTREWDRGEMAPSHTASSSRDNYGESRDWNDRQWDSTAANTSGNWQQEGENENWDNTEEKEWQDYHRVPQEKIHHEAEVHQMANVGRGCNRRWTNWRGRGRGNQHHHGDYRRQNHQHHIHGGHQEHIPDRSEMTYRRPHPTVQQGDTHHVAGPAVATVSAVAPSSEFAAHGSAPGK